MTNALLTDADRKEALSLVYAKAIAARAGYSTSVPTPDRDSVDLRIQAGGPRRPALDLQLKATVKLRQTQADILRFRIDVTNYNDLCAETQTPRLLVVLALPEDESRWMTVTPKCLVLRRCAFWMSLQKGYREVYGQQTVTVHIPKRNLFDVTALKELMERSRKGAIW